MLIGPLAAGGRAFVEVVEVGVEVVHVAREGKRLWASRETPMNGCSTYSAICERWGWRNRVEGAIQYALGRRARLYRRTAS